MTFRPMTPEDRAAVVDLLRADTAGTMFPQASLHGSGHPADFWVTGAPIAGVIGLSRTGWMLMPHAPGSDWTGARAALAGQPVAGFAGRPDQVSAVRAALGLDAIPARFDSIEPGYALDLSALTLPDCTGFTLAPLTAADAPLIHRWRAAYEAELFATPPEEAAANARDAFDRWLAAGSHRLLWHDGQPVALSGFNARLPDTVQIGGVYVPPDLRGRGLARRVVGLHLVQARQDGIRTAVLFAASDPAERAYRALGFLPAGRFALILFPQAAKVQPCP